MKVYAPEDMGALIARTFRKDYVYTTVAVRGTVSGLHVHFSGQVFFSLIDEKGRILCTAGKGKSSFLLRSLREGILATVIGNFRYEPKAGRLVLYGERIIDTGKSPQTMAKEALFRELEEKGWFDAGRKRSLPPYPFHIAVITSRSGAVIHDIVATGRRRNPAVAYTLWSSAVQGEGAALSMAEALRRMEESEPLPDVVIIARGGGAEEDLAPFNERCLAEAVHMAKVPVISAVGHEINVTLTDLVADRRASTPTQAAEIAVPEKGRIKADISKEMGRLTAAAKAALAARKEEIRRKGRFLREGASLLHARRLPVEKSLFLLEKETRDNIRKKRREVVEHLCRFEK